MSLKKLKSGFHDGRVSFSKIRGAPYNYLKKKKTQFVFEILHEMCVSTISSIIICNTFKQMKISFITYANGNKSMKDMKKEERNNFTIKQ